MKKEKKMLKTRMNLNSPLRYAEENGMIMESERPKETIKNEANLSNKIKLLLHKKKFNFNYVFNTCIISYQLIKYFLNNFEIFFSFMQPAPLKSHIFIL